MIQSLTQAIFLLQQLVGQVSWVVDLLPLLQVECEALSDILGLMTVSELLKHLPRRKKKDGGSDHYFKKGLIRQQEMTISADKNLDDYIEDDN